ncbi:unnamed protein product [Vicia faba]|uniref:Uncharacterized protein n=1 Tax=Vicia faba TaxID=3906 RepID=A0AAV1AY22_VICFA|nr:unnamed protein product [Vicia faba]
MRNNKFKEHHDIPQTVSDIFFAYQRQWNKWNVAHLPCHLLLGRTVDDEDLCVSGLRRFQEPGKAEAEFAKASPDLVIKNMLTSRNSGPPILPKEGTVLYNPEAARAKPLPSWLSQEDINYYASKFEKSGFTGGLNYYRNFNLNWELTAAWTGAQIKGWTKKNGIGSGELGYRFDGLKRKGLV